MLDTKKIFMGVKHLFSGLYFSFRKLLVLLVVSLPALMTLNYISTISNMTNSSPSALLNTYNLIDLSSRVSVVFILIFVLSNLEKKPNKLIVFISLPIVVLTYTTFVNVAFSIVDQKNVITNYFFAYSLTASALSIIYAGIIFSLWIILFNAVTSFKKYKLKIALLTLFLTSVVFALLLCIKENFISIKNPSMQYALTYTNRFKMLILSLILVSLLYFGMQYFDEVKRKKVSLLLIPLSLVICLLCLITLNKSTTNLTFFMLNFAGASCAIPVVIYVKDKKISSHTSFTLLKRTIRLLVSMLLVYSVILLTQNCYYWLLHSDFIKLNQLGYLSYFINTLSAILTGLALYFPQHLEISKKLL